MLPQIAPLAFVFLWSTGWIVARYTADFADPLWFLFLRFVFAGAILAAFAVAAGAPWPKTRRSVVHALVSGTLLHSFYLGGVWWSVQHGMPASLSALIAALQPILTALLAPVLLGERFDLARAAGVALGFAGLLLVIAPRLTEALAAGPGPVPAGVLLLVNSLAMVSVTAGTFYQKRFVHGGDLRTIAVLQYVGAAVAILPAVFAVGEIRFHASLFAWEVMAWTVIGISVGAVILLLLLIRQGELSRASQLLFLVPPLGAIEAMILFGERLAPVQWAGVAVTTGGVALAMRRG